jgi:hypothetical protein
VRVCARALHLSGAAVLVGIIVGSDAVGAGEHSVRCNAHAGARALLNQVHYTLEQLRVAGTTEARAGFLRARVRSQPAGGPAATLANCL